MSSSENDYSPQAVFDATVRHLASMSGPSITPSKTSWTCMYRGPGGSRCAVGYWIPDEAYKPNMEKRQVFDGVNSTIVAAALPEPMRAIRILKLLNDLQEIHDNDHYWTKDHKAWESKLLADALRRMARRRRLRMSVINECFP